MAERAAAIMPIHRFLVEHPERAVFVHRDLFENDPFFGREIVFAERGAHHLAEEFQRVAQVLGEHVSVKGGEVAARVRVVPRSHLIESSVQCICRDLLGPLEHHVFEEMAHTHERGCFIARAGSYEEARGGTMSMIVTLRNNCEPIWQTFGLIIDSHAEIVSPEWPEAQSWGKSD